MKRNLAGIGALAACLTLFIGPQAYAEAALPQTIDEPSAPAPPEERSSNTEIAEETESLPEGSESTLSQDSPGLDDLTESGVLSESDDPEGWFTDGAAESGELPGDDAEASVVRLREADLDTAEALNDLIDIESLITFSEAERVAVPMDSEIEFGAFDGEKLTVHIEEIGIVPAVDGFLPTVEALGSVASGEAPGGTTSFAFVTDDEGEYQLLGDIEGTNSGDIGITPTGDDTYHVAEVDSSRETLPASVSGDDMVIEPPAEEVELFDEPGCTGPGCVTSRSSQPSNVTLLIGVARGTGDLGSLKAQMTRVVASTNAAFVTSRINARLSLMETMSVNYSQNTRDAMRADHNTLSQGAQGLKPLKTKRDTIGADLVALIVPVASPTTGSPSERVCGRGSVGLKTGTPDAAFSVTAKTCLSNGTFQHEIGHNLGAAHNPEDTSAELKRYVPSYAYGHRVASVASDIMAYPCNDNNCPRQNQYANPAVPFIGASGHPSGTSTRNAARAIGEMAQVASRYRTTVVGGDVSQNHKFHREIIWLINRGITTGYADGTFRPGAAVTREAMSAFLYRMAGRPSFTPPATTPYKDAPKGSQFYKEITWMRAEGILRAVLTVRSDRRIR